MTQAYAALLPVFLVIVLGFALRRFRVVTDDHWLAADQLCYKVLFPALIFKEIATADFTSVPVWTMAGAMMAAISTMFVLLLLFRERLSRSMNIDAAGFASLFQGATRWHTFIALALIPAFFGQTALALGAVAAAAMIPLLNIVNVWVHVHYIGENRTDIRGLALSLLANPFVTSSLAGVLWKATGWPLLWPVAEVLDITGRGALGLALLSVGAGLSFDGMTANPRPLAMAVGLKLLVMPVFMVFWCWAFGVTGEAAAVALLCGAVPTGSGAYVLARQMGGDAPLVANTLTLQVIFAAVTIPLVLTISG